MTLPKLEKIEKYARLSAEDRNKLCADLSEWYETGVPLRELANKIGKSLKFVQNLFEEGGVKTRAPGGSKPHPETGRDEQKAEYFLLRDYLNSRYAKGVRRAWLMDALKMALKQYVPPPRVVAQKAASEE